METTNSFTPPKISKESFDKVESFLHVFDTWSLLSFEQIAQCIKSLILPMLLSMREITPTEAVDLSMVELDFQTDRWGRVEWHHDIERQAVYAKIAASSAVMLYGNSSIEEYSYSPLDRLKLIAHELELEGLKRLKEQA